MKKRIHIFEEWDVVERLVRPYFRYFERHLMATSLSFVTTKHGGLGYACFDFVAPYPEDENFDGNTQLFYVGDVATRQFVYRRANHIEEPSPNAVFRAYNWVNLKCMEHGIRGYWECKKCGYSTVGEADPTRVPEKHLAAHGVRWEWLFAHMIEPTPPEPPLPVGTFYARRHLPDRDQWVVCQISRKHQGYVPWSEKTISMHRKKEEARQELVRLVSGK
jgi:hypothetical protein